MKIRTVRDLFFDQLRDLYSAESQLIPSIPKLAEQAYSPELASLLRDHADETEIQRGRVLQIFQNHDEKIGNDECKAIKGLIKGGDHHIELAEGPKITDLILMAHCNRVEHYEIAGYMFAAALAECMGMVSEAAILNETLAEERKMTIEMGRIASGMFGECDSEGGEV